MLEARAHLLVVWPDAAQERAHARVDARAEEDERRVLDVAVRHHQQPVDRRHPARHVHHRVALVGGGARIRAAQREAVHGCDAVLRVAHRLARVRGAVEADVQKGRRRVGHLRH